MNSLLAEGLPPNHPWCTKIKPGYLHAVCLCIFVCYVKCFIEIVTIKLEYFRWKAGSREKAQWIPEDTDMTFSGKC